MPHGASLLVASLLAFSALRVAAMDGANGFTYSYCSSQNTNSSASSFFWTWQSNGKCHDHCNEQGTYAFAVISHQQCWCSNIVPSQTLDMSDCSETCPGFKEERCATDGESFLYVKLDGQPSGTAAGSSPSASKTKSSQTTQSSTASQPSASPDNSSPPAPGHITTVTENGVTFTKIIYPSDSGAALHETNNGGSSTNTGAIVGGVVGGIGILAAVVGGVLFFLWRRRKQQREDAEGGQGGEGGVQRYASTMSRSGLLRGEKTPQEPAPIATSFNRSRRQSRNLDQDSISPISASDRRNSSFRIDQRLNPSTIFAFDNSSAVSVGSLDDSRDYHRTLNVRNPDTQ